MNAAVLELLKKTAAVPSMPQLVLRFLEVMQDPDFDYADLAKALSADPGTVSEILRLCNSALFGVRQKVASLRQALTLVGPKRTRSLLLGRYLVDSLASKPAAGLDTNYFWRRSLACGVASARFSDVLLPRQREEVFIAALLADIGIPILAEAIPDRYAPIVSRFAPKHTAITVDDERKAVDVTHAEVSAMVLSHWTLPDVVCRAVNLHQAVSNDEGDASQIARIINAADRLSRLLCEVPAKEDILRVFGDLTALLPIDTDKLVSLLPSIETDIEELGSVLRVDVIPSKVYSLVAKTIEEQLSGASQ